MLANILGQFLNVFHVHSFTYEPNITSFSSSSKRFILKSCSPKKEKLEHTHFPNDPADLKNINNNSFFLFFLEDEYMRMVDNRSEYQI